MYHIFASLQKHIRNGEVDAAEKYVKDVIDGEYPCVISYREKPADIFEVTINVYSAEINTPLKITVQVSLEDNFLSIKRKICGELSGMSPYSQKLFIIKGTAEELVYVFPKNSEILQDHFPTKNDFKVNPICVYFTKMELPFDFDDGPMDESELNWSCMYCTFINKKENNYCYVCCQLRVKD